MTRKYMTLMQYFVLVKVYSRIDTEYNDAREELISQLSAIIVSQLL